MAELKQFCKEGPTHVSVYPYWPCQSFSFHEKRQKEANRLSFSALRIHPSITLSFTATVLFKHIRWMHKCICWWTQAVFAGMGWYEQHENGGRKSRAVSNSVFPLSCFIVSPLAPLLNQKRGCSFFRGYQTYTPIICSLKQPSQDPVNI